MKNPTRERTHTPRREQAVRLAAPRTAQAIMIAMIVLTTLVVLPLTLFGSGSGEAARTFAVGSVAALILYALLAASLVACMLPRLRGVPRRVSTAPRPRLRPEPHTVVVPVPFDPAAAEKVLRKAGYRHIASDDRSVWGVKNRWSPLGTVILHGALLLGTVAAALALVPGLERMEHVSALPTEVLGKRGPASGLTLASFTAEEDSDGTIASLSATLSFKDGREYRVRPDLPTLVGPATAVTIEDFDLAPLFSIVPTNAATPSFERTGKLRLREAESHDTMTIDAGDLGLYRIMVRRDGKGSDAVMASVSRLEAGEWHVVRPETRYRRGELLEVEGARVRFHGLEPYALLRVHTSPSSPLVTFVLFAAALGACLRLVFPRREVTVAAMDAGSGITVVVDVYKGSRNESSDLALALGEAS